MARSSSTPLEISYHLQIPSFPPNTLRGRRAVEEKLEKFAAGVPCARLLMKMAAGS